LYLIQFDSSRAIRQLLSPGLRVQALPALLGKEGKRRSPPSLGGTRDGPAVGPPRPPGANVASSPLWADVKPGDLGRPHDDSGLPISAAVVLDHQVALGLEVLLDELGDGELSAELANPLRPEVLC